MNSNRLFLTTLASLFLALSFITSTSFADEGHCSFTMENDFVGPFAACQMPASPDQCKDIGNEDKNKDAEHKAGECPMEEKKVVGVSEFDDFQKIYYEGDPNTLQTGCAFQGGDWAGK